nr:uncharacterized protein LOC106685667 [Halyomorpha halys]
MDNVCTLIFFLNILSHLESKYSNKFLRKEDGYLSKSKPFNKQDYINLINYETHSFSRRKNHWQENDKIDQFETIFEPKLYFLSRNIKNELKNSNNNLSSVDKFYKSKYYRSVNTLKDRNHAYSLLLPKLAKFNSFSSYKTVTRNATDFKKHNKRQTPFKIWIEEYNNNERRKYTTYIEVDKVTTPFSKSRVESTLSYEKQTKKPNIFYCEPLLNIPVNNDKKKINMAQRNFPIVLPVFKWKSKKEKNDEKKNHVTVIKYVTIHSGTKDHISTHRIQINRPKSIMDKLNEINLDDRCEPKKTTTIEITKKYSEKFCGVETETPFIEPTTTKHCKNYGGIIHCPNCNRRLKYNMEIIRNIQKPTICPTTFTCY